MIANVPWNMNHSSSGMVCQTEPRVTPDRKDLDRPPTRGEPAANARLYPVREDRN